MRNSSSFRLVLALFSLIIWLAPLAGAHAGYFDPKLKWYTLSTPHFNIHYHEGEEEVARRMTVIAEKVYAEQTPKFKWKPWGRVEVVLTDTTDISNAFTSTLPYNYILLFVPAPQGDSTLNYYEDWLYDLFLHEFTHTLHLDMYGGLVKPFRWVLGRIVTPNGLTPGWVREGIATQQESLTGKGRVNNSFSDMMLRTDLMNDQFLALDQMAGLQFDWPSSNAAYIYGGKFWAYLADTYGQDTVVEFSKRYSNSMWLFSLNNKARKTFGGKNFFKLHDEWKASLKEKYAKQRQEVEAKGLSSLSEVRHYKGSLSNPTLSPDGQIIIYSQTDVHNKPEIRRIRVDGSGDELISKGRIGAQYSFSPDGKKVVYSSMGTYKHYYKYFELFELDLQTKKSRQLTTGQRAFHPDYSPDGKTLVFVQNKVNTTRLALYDFETKKIKLLGASEPWVQYSNPRFSPDGKTIAVSAWRNGNRDIYLYDLEGKIVKQVTQDTAIDLNPIFAKDGADLFFTSDRTGITNVWRYNLASGQSEQVTNVLTGVFQPQFAGGKLVVQNYYGRGYDLKAMDYQPQPIAVAKAPAKKGKKGRRARAPKAAAVETAALTAPAQGDLAIGDPLARRERAAKTAAPEASATAVTAPDAATGATAAAPAATPGPELPESVSAELENLQPKKYNPFKKLFIPRYIQPNILFGDSVTITADIGSSDPLGWHRWTGGINYRTDANFLGGQFNYSYNRLKPTIFAGFYDFVVDYGDVFGINQSFFEERRRGFVGASIGTGEHLLAGYYFFENRSAESAIPPGAILPPTLGNFSGFGMRYTWNRAAYYPASISLEGGPRLQINVEGTDQALGSSPNNEQLIIQGDLREYVPLPLDGHVLAFRLAGGIAFGDRLLQGTFRLGSALGEGTLSAVTPRLFTLRGLPQITFAGERALLMSGEYRLPLVYPQRGLGTTPIHLNKLYMVFFADYGSVFNGDIDFDNFLLGVGAELRGDFVIGYGLPITARLGYGIIVSGRQFIQGLKDPITNASITNGTLILSLGTSF
ncbi:hypothetical protein FBR05_05640 [Deltaproteobacteria bacterium PRO3]|nr:hypothetical protein [Deltaproteobacteria bacterium PRO3]